MSNISRRKIMDTEPSPPEGAMENPDNMACDPVVSTETRDSSVSPTEASRSPAHLPSETSESPFLSKTSSKSSDNLTVREGVSPRSPSGQRESQPEVETMKYPPMVYQETLLPPLHTIGLRHPFPTQYVSRLYWQALEKFLPESGGMGDPGPAGVGGTAPPESTAARTRKRILDPLETHDDDNNARRPGIFSDWQETLKSIGVPNKKGFITMEGGPVRHWDAEDIDQGLAADFDDSLSGLGVDISTASYNMNEALMALPSVPLFKQESLSPNIDKQSIASSTPATFDESSQSNTTDRLFKILNSESLAEGSPPSIHQLLSQHLTMGGTQPSASTSQVTSAVAAAAASTHLTTAHHTTVQHTTADAGQDLVTIPTHSSVYEDKRFQYILGAATSIAMKVSEESLTYLNQGQSYEIKVKKLGDLTRCKGKLYHTMIRVCFHERRLQYMEKELLHSWQQTRPGERILEVDIPLSYGVFEVSQDSRTLNVCEFDWDPTREVGVYIKVNCISSEFTPKKHGGEKGVPFRIQIETYQQTDSGLERLYVCACQIKVFKLKGADRKHKQDREKIMKRPRAEQEKCQPSCECTILTELSQDSVYLPVTGTTSPVLSPTAAASNTTIIPPLRTHSPAIESRASLTPNDTAKIVENGVVGDHDEEEQGNSLSSSSLGINTNSGQTASWLKANRFTKYNSMFASFTGSDILRLTRSDLIEMCGLADGIRLFNALHAKPQLTVYVCLEHEQIYHAVYLNNLTCYDFTRKVSSLMHITPERIHDVYLQGPSGIHILVTDEVVQNMAEESMLSIEVLQDTAGERFRLLLRHTNQGLTS